MLLTVAYPAGPAPATIPITSMSPTNHRYPHDNTGDSSSDESATHISISRINVPLVAVLVFLSFTLGIALTFGIQLATVRHDQQALVELTKKVDALLITTAEIHEKQAVQERTIQDMSSKVDQVAPATNILHPGSLR